MATDDSTPHQPPIRLVIVDADRRVRDGLASLAGSCEQVNVVGEAGHPGGALDIVETERPHVALIDPRLPEVDNGLALIRAIRAWWPKVVVLAMGWSDELEAACLAAGAYAFVPKTSVPNEFIDAIVAAGRRAQRAADGLEASVAPLTATSRHALGDGVPRPSDTVPTTGIIEPH